MENERIVEMVEKKSFKQKMNDARVKVGHFLYDNKEVVAIATGAVATGAIVVATNKARKNNREKYDREQLESINYEMQKGIAGSFLESVEFDDIEGLNRQRANDIGMTARVTKALIKDDLDDLRDRLDELNRRL
ncbi:MAG: hypothetical protein ACRCX2_22560 [Paraclostridium sp.]